MAFRPAVGPVKTAPKLYQDFLVFDPANTTTGNVLALHPPPVGEGPQLVPHLSSCKHDYTTKMCQSRQPPLDSRPDGTTQFKLAMVCKKCRMHADIRISYMGSVNACPNLEWPLHPFQRLASQDITTTTRIRYAWRCCAPQCQSVLHIDYRQPRLTPGDIDLLTNPEWLKRRYENVVKRDPAREGLRQATPMESLSRLKKYVHDSLSSTHTKRSFPANNKRFMESCGWMGEDCKPILERLGFKYAAEVWDLPEPEVVEDMLRADGSSPRELLEDVEFELLALMYKQASENGVATPSGTEVWDSANHDVERTLAAQGYQRCLPSRRTGVANDVLPYFASLGILPDFSDKLITFSFDRQIHCDPAGQPYYFECLQVLAEARGTEELQLKVVTMQSQDMVSRRDINQAYRFLHIPEPTYQQDDNRILDCFQAMLGDVSQQAAEDARQALWKIGTSRGSQKLIRASRQSLETYDDALAWLGNGLHKESPDDAILAVLAVKNDENAANQEIGRQAVSVIANARGSQYLKDYLTGNADANSMSVDEALRHLNITEKIESLSPDVLAFVFSNARVDRPGTITERAVKTIKAALAGGLMSNRPPPETWPVGLTSHGNTCYLNSLLQYYFSIKPFRDIVLNFDKHKFSGQELKKTHRVNGVFLKSAEIASGQQYAGYLRALFQCMISDPGFSVKPENALIKRTFLDLADYYLLDEPTATSMDSQATENNEIIPVVDTPPQDNNDDAKMVNAEGPLTPPPSPGHEPQKHEVAGTPSLPPRPVALDSHKKNEKLALADERVRNQQDVNDVLDKVMTRLRAGIAPTGFDKVDEEQADELRDIFLIGMTETEDVAGTTPSQAKKASDIHIQLQVPTENTDLYAALDRYFDLQADVGDRHTYKSIHRLPSVFQVAIPRSFRDPQGNNQKAEQLVRLEDELYLDRYVDNSSPDLLNRRRDCWSLRRQVQRLKDEKQMLVQTAVGLDGPTTLAETAKYLQQNIKSANEALEDIGVEPIEVPTQLPDILISDSTHLLERDVAISKEIEGLEQKLQGRFDDLKDFKYRLAAVFMHQGGGGGGHYWIYIHDFTSDTWRKYNDETVESVTELQDIYESKPGKRIPTPTYAVYVQDGAKDHIFQPVCRKLDPPLEVKKSAQEPASQMSDVEMTEPFNSIKPQSRDAANGSWDSSRQDSNITW